MACRPRIYAASDIVFNEKSVGRNITAQEIWDADKERLEKIKSHLPDVKVFIIWESDWKKDPDKAIEPVIKEYERIFGN